jgi:putative Holliday junction resolvase
MRQKIAALGLDVGKKRLGVAGCDGTGLIATEIETIERTSFAKDLDRLRKIIADREVNILVIGLPYSLNGTLGFQAQQVQKFAEKVSQALDLPVEYVDERLTSVEAIELLKAQKRFSTRNKGAIDRLAAVIILQQWLDMRRSRNG